MQITAQSTAAKPINDLETPPKPNLDQPRSEKLRERELSNTDPRSYENGSSVRMKLQDNNHDIDAVKGQEDSWFSDPEP